MNPDDQDPPEPIEVKPGVFISVMTSGKDVTTFLPLLLLLSMFQVYLETIWFTFWFIGERSTWRQGVYGAQVFALVLGVLATAAWIIRSMRSQ
jgi:hypothetical protein